MADDVDDGEQELDRRLRNLNEYLTAVFAARRDDPARRAAFLAKLAEQQAHTPLAAEQSPRHRHSTRPYC